MESIWRVEMLGGLQVRGQGVLIDRFRTRQTAALLGYLAYRAGHDVLREVAIEAIWPECEPESGRQNLNTALWSLRKLLEPEAVPSRAVIQGDRLRLRVSAAALTTDVAEFEARLRLARHVSEPEERVRCLREALELYRGDLLPGHYEDWVLPEQSRLSTAYGQAMRQLLPLLEQAGQLEDAIRYASEAVRADPHREEGYYELMRLCSAAGLPGEALRHYRELERRLSEDLKTSPVAATRSLAQALLGGTREIPQEGRVDGARPPEWSSAPVAPAPGLSAASFAPVLPTAPPDESGGAVPLDSRFYVVRAADDALRSAIGRGSGVVLLKDPRETGKSSLLTRGLQFAREKQARVVLTDLRKCTAADLTSSDGFLRLMANWIADQLGLLIAPRETWNPELTPALNLESYLRRVALADVTGRLVWGFDEADRLLQYPLAGEVFGLFRAWHNARALDPEGPWGRLTVVIAYSAEAQFFVSDPDQSPFNVGVRVVLSDFSPEQVADLNRRSGSPLSGTEELVRYARLLGGHPHLVRRGLQEMAKLSLSLDEIERDALHSEGPFSSHLRRLEGILGRDQELLDGIRTLLARRPLPEAAFFRPPERRAAFRGHSGFRVVPVPAVRRLFPESLRNLGPLMSFEAQSFYVAGGTLRHDAPCYARRHADAELEQALERREFCYVLTSRQMGKSSLMVRTAFWCREQGNTAILLDLTAIGRNVTADQWYRSLLSHTGRQTGLEGEIEEYWKSRADLSPVERWLGALEDVVLPHAPGRVVVFFDEVDYVRGLPFSTDELFAAIRSVYNRRSFRPELERLTFCVLGVTTPAELIRAPDLTPFNIGRRIELHDLLPEEAVVLLGGLADLPVDAPGGPEEAPTQGATSERSRGSRTRARRVLDRILF